MTIFESFFSARWMGRNNIPQSGAIISLSEGMYLRTSAMCSRISSTVSTRLLTTSTTPSTICGGEKNHKPMQKFSLSCNVKTGQNKGGLEDYAEITKKYNKKAELTLSFLKHKNSSGSFLRCLSSIESASNPALSNLLASLK